MDWLLADLLWIFACKLRGLHNEKRRVLISPAAPAVIGLYPLAQGADVAAKFRRPSGDRADLSGESGIETLTPSNSPTQMLWRTCSAMMAVLVSLANRAACKAGSRADR